MVKFVTFRGIAGMIICPFGGSSGNGQVQKHEQKQQNKLQQHPRHLAALKRKLQTEKRQSTKIYY